MGGLKLVTKATEEPLSLEEVRAHLRLTDAADDPYLEQLIGATRRTVEQAYGMVFVSQTWQLALDEAPASRELELKPSPLVSVGSITSYDEDGAATVMNASTYLVDTFRVPGRVVLKRDAVWPSALREANGIVIEFVAGLGATANAIDWDAKMGLLAIVAALYEERLPVYEVSGERVALLGGDLLAPYRTMRLG